MDDPVIFTRPSTRGADADPTNRCSSTPATRATACCGARPRTPPPADWRPLRTARSRPPHPAHRSAVPRRPAATAQASACSEEGARWTTGRLVSRACVGPCVEVAEVPALYDARSMVLGHQDVAAGPLAQASSQLAISPACREGVAVRLRHRQEPHRRTSGPGEVYATLPSSRCRIPRGEIVDAGVGEVVGHAPDPGQAPQVSSSASAPHAVSTIMARSSLLEPAQPQAVRSRSRGSRSRYSLSVRRTKRARSASEHAYSRTPSRMTRCLSNGGARSRSTRSTTCGRTGRARQSPGASCPWPLPARPCARRRTRTATSTSLSRRAAPRARLNSHARRTVGPARRPRATSHSRRSPLSRASMSPEIGQRSAPAHGCRAGRQRRSRMRFQASTCAC